ncbi:hypothetical protein DL96DRAFT_1818055 [Flagelloscypha sp. PMI_526]|nr:hypothetical protein DL96DRAFT_1818055 [Flagelloscypha sp. PMI_526]
MPPVSVFHTRSRSSQVCVITSTSSTEMKELKAQPFESSEDFHTTSTLSEEPGFTTMIPYELPYDILESVILFSVDSAGIKVGSNLSLVSRSFYDIALPRLYMSLVIQTDSALCRIARTWIQRPSLAGLVKILSITVTKNIALVHRVLTLTRNLRALHIQENYVLDRYVSLLHLRRVVIPSLCTTTFDSCPHLTHLCLISSPVKSISHIVLCRGALPELTHLFIADTLDEGSLHVDNSRDEPDPDADMNLHIAVVERLRENLSLGLPSKLRILVLHLRGISYQHLNDTSIGTLSSRASVAIRELVSFDQRIVLSSAKVDLPPVGWAGPWIIRSPPESLHAERECLGAVPTHSFDFWERAERHLEGIREENRIAPGVLRRDARLITV